MSGKQRTINITSTVVAGIVRAIAVGGCGGSPEEIANATRAEATESASMGLKEAEQGGSHRRFFVPPPDRAAVTQFKALIAQGDVKHAFALAELVSTPQAVWFQGGTPTEVKVAVRKTIVEAKLQRSVPVLVAYNLPFRDCAQYSGGGALDTAAYEAWIDGFAKGIGDSRAMVILEPDGLGLIPYNTALGGTKEWCQPTVTDAQGNTVPAPGADPDSRYAQLNYAVDNLAANAPNAFVYLDGTHSAWLGAGDSASRLVRAGVQRARGFFLDVSNYQPTPQLVQYGTWVAKCIYYANNPAEGGWRVGHYDYCASQYYPASPNDYSTWALTDQWYADNVDNAANPPAGPAALAHFVVDTGRNGQGPLSATPYGEAPYNQPSSVLSALGNGAWCNAPNAGAGLRPTGETGQPLADAFLWIKTPGESDGSCDIAGGARGWDYTAYNPWLVPADQQNLFDPLWGIVDPAAGVWFPALALRLADNANPPLFP